VVARCTNLHWDCAWLCVNVGTIAAHALLSHCRVVPDNRAKRQFSTSKQACIKIQTSFRSKNARRLYSSQQEAAVKLHAVARGFIQKRRVMGFIGAIIKLQSYVRRRKFRGRHVHVLRSRKKWRDILHSGEAVLLQSLVCLR